MVSLAKMPTRMRVWALCAFVVVLGLFVVAQRAAAAEEKPSYGERLVTIYDQGVEQTIITKAGDVKAALDHAGIILEQADGVEPGLDEELVAKNYRINIYRARPVLIVDGKKRVSVVTAEQSPRRIVELAGEKLYDEDVTELRRVNSVLDEGGAGIKLYIDRATVFSFTLYGKTFEARTQATTVGDMLKEKGVELGPDDGTSLPLHTKITSGMKIGVWREGKQTITVEESIERPVEEIQDTSREYGYREVKTTGKDGKKQVTYEIEMRDGREVSRRAISSVTTLEPVKEVVVVGAKIAGPAEIISRIEYWSNKRGIDASRVARIARCESTFNPLASNGYHQGLFQHDPEYWPARAARYGFAGASIVDVEAQIAVSTAMMAEGGWYHWECQ